MRSRTAPAGLRVLPGDTLLVERARDYLAGGPAAAAELVARVFGIANASPASAETIVATRLGAYEEFVRDVQGRWWLTEMLAAVERARGPVTLPAPGPAPQDVPLSALSYAVVDVETTGTSPERGDRITEIAAVLVRGGEIVERYETLVNPEMRISRFITGLTGITDAMVADKPRFRELCPEITSRLEGHVFVAHNVSFDWRFVSAEVSRSTGERLDGRRLCTVRLARKLLPQLRRRSLGDVCNHYGFVNAARHRALGDAEATARVLIRLLGEAADRGCTTWGALESFLSTPAASARRRRRPPGLPGWAHGGEGA